MKGHVSDSSSRGATSLRAALKEFIDGRREARLTEAGANEAKRVAMIEKFSFDSWLAYAAARVERLQAATHGAKFSHPSVKGATSIFKPPGALSTTGRGDLVDTTNLSGGYLFDLVTGNAANLDKDLNQFLRFEFGGKSILDRIASQDSELEAALSGDQERARRLMQSFAKITEPLYEPASHTLAKQVYWLVGEDPTSDSDYHLLAPLYATSLAHRLFQTINEHRFGDAAKAARKARREERFAEDGYHEYPNLAIQRLGGTKPQNISQLNSERSGNNYLLASLPPNWQTRTVRAPLGTDSVFKRFGTMKSVRSLVRSLRQFLQGDPASTLHTRNRRDDYTSAIIDQLVLFTSELQSLDPGWSEQPACRLPEAEKLWLDPGRAELDEAFARQRETTDWPAEICHRFGNWLNDQLNDALAVGDVEHRHWAKMLEREIDSLQEVLRDA